jgi:hypothetical protein
MGYIYIRCPMPMISNAVEREDEILRCDKKKVTPYNVNKN